MFLRGIHFTRHFLAEISLNQIKPTRMFPPAASSDRQLPLRAAAPHLLELNKLTEEERIIKTLLKPRRLSPRLHREQVLYKRGAGGEAEQRFTLLHHRPQTAGVSLRRRTAADQKPRTTNSSVRSRAERADEQQLKEEKY